MRKRPRTSEAGIHVGLRLPRVHLLALRAYAASKDWSVSYVITRWIETSGLVPPEDHVPPPPGGDPVLPRVKPVAPRPANGPVEGSPEWRRINNGSAEGRERIRAWNEAQREEPQ